MKSQRRIWHWCGMILVLALVLILLAPPVQAKVVSKFKATGDYGLVYWDDGNVFGYLQVYRGTQSPDWSGRRTFLIYDVFNYNTGEEEYGHGFIPDGDLTGGGTQPTLTLNTDLSTNADFIVELGPSGVISATWTQTDHWVNASGGQITNFFSSISKSTGTAEINYSEPAGNVLGNPFSPDIPYYAEMGKTNSLSVEIQKGP